MHVTTICEQALLASVSYALFFSLPVLSPALLTSLRNSWVRQSIDALRKDKQRVSLATVTAKSKEQDTQGNGKGISESAILDNEEARTYYEQHRSWQGTRKKRAKPLTVASSAPLAPTKLDRNDQRVRQRYLRNVLN